MRNTETLRRLIRPLLGLALLLSVLSQLQIERLQAAWFDVHPGWCAGAFLSALGANVLCALRWQHIVADFGGSISKPAAIALYFQGVAANTVLPGGIVGGDIWRTLGLAKQGMSKLIAAKTVFLDRASGFWSLSVLAVPALLVSRGRALVDAPAAMGVLYSAAMLAIALGPFVLLPLRAAQSRIIFKTAAVSIASQALTIFAFVACLRAVNVTADLTAIAALCAGIFLGAVVPASIGGFGSRELASLFLLSVLGIAPEAAFLGSVLFGLTATLQGLISLAIWIRPGSRD